jgi:hypothetical protein
MSSAKFALWQMTRIGAPNEKFDTEAKGLARLEALLQLGEGFAVLSHPFTRWEYELRSEGVTRVKNHSGFAAWFSEQILAYALLPLGAAIAYALWALNPSWAWWFIVSLGAVLGPLACTFMIFALSEPCNKTLSVIGGMVYLLPSLAAYYVYTHPNFLM